MVNYCDFLTFFEKKAKIFFAGIGGISMSSLALISKSRGAEVLGYDSADNEVIDRLVSSGIPVYKEFSEDLFDDVGLVVYTGAIRDDSPFLAFPREKGIPMIKRPLFLGYLMKSTENPIGIAGTHGKSTTTGMISSIFISAMRDPTVLIGAEYDFPDKTFLIGGGKDFIFEACEYQDSFLSFFPRISLILNVEYDHADYFPNFGAVLDSFVKWADLSKNGYAVVNMDNFGAKEVAKRTVSPVFTFSTKEKADIYAENIVSHKGFYSFTLVTKEKETADIQLSVAGLHNVSNALAAASAAYLSGIPLEMIAIGLKKYHGIKRRFEMKGVCNDMVVIDDYAHHPDEIKATMKAAKELGAESVTVVFQSHTFTRTQAYFDDFISSLASADEVIFADIYPAREKPIPDIDAEHLAKASKNGKYVGNFKEIEKYLLSLKRNGLLIIMGAGDIVNITPNIITGEL